MDITKREITKIAREVSRFTARTLRSTGVGTGEMDVLHLIRKNPGITQSEVCRELGLDKGAVARQTGNLEAKGYIELRENPGDRRSRLLYPTPLAEGLKKSKAHVEAAFYQWLLEGLSEEERAEYARMTDILYRRCKTESREGFPEMTERMENEV